MVEDVKKVENERVERFLDRTKADVGKVHDPIKVKKNHKKPQNSKKSFQKMKNNANISGHFTCGKWPYIWIR